MAKKQEGDKAYDSGIKTGVKCTIVKVLKKEGKKSGVPLGVRVMILGGKPTVGKPLYGTYESEHALSGDPKIVKFPASSIIQRIHRVNNAGLCIETETSVLLVTTTIF